MLTKLQKIGNSTGVIIPSQLIKSTGMKAGSKVEVVAASEGSGFSVMSASKRRKSLQEVLDKCDLNAPEVENLWEGSATVGDEML